MELDRFSCMYEPDVSKTLFPIGDEKVVSLEYVYSKITSVILYPPQLLIVYDTRTAGRPFVWDDNVGATVIDAETIGCSGLIVLGLETTSS